MFPSTMGISEAVTFAVRDFHRAGLNPRLGDPEGHFGWLVQHVTSRPVEVEHDPDDIYTEAERTEPHAHYRVRWACYPSEAWLLADHPRYLLEEGELERFQPRTLTMRTDGAVTEMTDVRLPVRCDTCASALSVGDSHSDGIAVVPIAAGVTVVLVALCGECERSLLTPDVKINRLSLD